MDATATSLIASLQQGADHRNLYRRFSSYLRPFSDFIPLDAHDPSRTRKKPPRRENSQSPTASGGLAKKFISFINKALKFLPLLLKTASNEDPIEEKDDELLAVYALLLDCFGCLLFPLELYRMPSIGNILLTLDRNYQRHKEKKREVLFDDSYFPKVDPYDSYYLLNPNADMNTEDDLKLWLEELNFEGRTRVPQTSKELGLVLRNHDMFFYFGHGSGTQYISRGDIEKLEIRAAALLMGCSSGMLQCKGSYAPQGAPLSYLFAGSPAVIANLWDVTDRDIDIFSKAVVNSWVEEAQPASCLTCELLNRRDEKPTRGRGRGRGRGRKRQVGGDGKHRRWCEECATRRIASSISKARDACNYPLLTGAAAVCYGVPTFLKRKG